MSSPEHQEGPNLNPSFLKAGFRSEAAFVDAVCTNESNFSLRQSEPQTLDDFADVVDGKFEYIKPALIRKSLGRAPDYRPPQSLWMQ